MCDAKVVAQGNIHRTALGPSGGVRAREYRSPYYVLCAGVPRVGTLTTISFEPALIRTGAKMGTREINSPAFKRFRLSFFEDKDFWRNGLDTVALLLLEGEERMRAEEMLVGQLPDERGIIGLGELRSRRAEPELMRLFEAEREAR